MTFAFLFGILFALQGCKPPGLKVERDRDGEEHLLLLKNTRAILGILPEAGGRTVVYRRPWGRNLLDADPVTWDTQTRPVPLPAKDRPWVNYRGHTTWTSPQKDWWPEQDKHWPPDPWWEFGRFQVREQSSVHVILEGPVSPVTLTSMRKRIQLMPDGSVEHQVTLTNHGEQTRQFGISSNTRFKARASVYVPLPNPEAVRPEYDRYLRPGIGPTPFQVEAGFFTFPRQMNFPSGLKGRGGTFYLDTDRAWVAAIYRDALFVKRFAPGDLDAPPQPHAPIEIFFGPTAPGNEPPSLLELEIHSRVATLEPGASMTVTEFWKLLDYQQQNITQAEISYLNGLIQRERLP